MNSDIEFKNEKGLYEKIRPALYSKRKEVLFIYKDSSFIKEVDIYNYLVNFTWKQKTNLSLNEIVSDIFDTDVDKIYEYVMSLISKERKEKHNEDGSLL